jgi:predicted lipid-binding transport protein (Tim44 family)
VATLSIAVVMTGFPSQQISPIIGLFGTIIGFLLGQQVRPSDGALPTAAATGPPPAPPIPPAATAAPPAPPTPTAAAATPPSPPKEVRPTGAGTATEQAADRTTGPPAAANEAQRGTE